MRISFDVEAPPVFKRQSRASLVQLTAQHIPAENVGNLQIHQVGNVHDLAVRGKPPSDPLAPRSIQQQLDGAGGIKDHQRSSRSS